MPSKPRKHTSTAAKAQRCMGQSWGHAWHSACSARAISRLARAVDNLSGVLAPHATLPAAIVPSPAQQATEHPADHAHAHVSPARMSWALLLKRVFDIDIQYCPNCGGRLKIIAAIVDLTVIAQILTHLHLPA